MPQRVDAQFYLFWTHPLFWRSNASSPYRYSRKLYGTRGNDFGGATSVGESTARDCIHVKFLTLE